MNGIGLFFCSILLVLLMVPGVIAFAMTIRMRGWKRVFFLAILFAFSIWLGRHAYDCNVHESVTCTIDDLYIFLGMACGVTTIVGIIAGIIRNLFRRSPAMASPQ